MSQDSSSHRKPTGETGPLHVSDGPGGIETDWQKIDLSDEKGDVEEFILRSFLQTVEKNGFLHYWVTSYTKNELDDFDFSVETTAGPKTIELMEVAPLDQVEGGYSEAPSTFNVYEFAEWVHEKIQKKSRRYEGVADKNLILLTYATDWKFWPGQGALCLLQYWALQKPHNFEEIHFHVPAGPQGGIGWPIYPTPEEHWEDFDPEQVRGSKVHKLDPDDWEVGRGEPSDLEDGDD